MSVGVGRIFESVCLSAAESWLLPTERASAVKTRMNGLSCGEESMTICSAVLIQYQRVTDGQTDGQTSSLYLLRASA